jgi:hypothetical protein
LVIAFAGVAKTNGAIAAAKVSPAIPARLFEVMSAIVSSIACGRIP